MTASERSRDVWKSTVAVPQTRPTAECVRRTESIDAAPVLETDMLQLVGLEDAKMTGHITKGIEHVRCKLCKVVAEILETNVIARGTMKWRNSPKGIPESVKQKLRTFV